MILSMLTDSGISCFLLCLFSQKPHPWGVEREERDGGRQKEVSPLIKIGIFYFGDEVSKQGHWTSYRQNFNKLYIFCCCILQKICEFLNCEDVKLFQKFENETMYSFNHMQFANIGFLMMVMMMKVLTMNVMMKKRRDTDDDK